MFDVSVVLLVPGVEFVAFVERTISHSTGTADAVTPSNEIVNPIRSTPNCAGVMTMRVVLAVAADKETAAEVLTMYPALAMSWFLPFTRCRTARQLEMGR